MRELHLDQHGELPWTFKSRRLTNEEILEYWRRFGKQMNDEFLEKEDGYFDDQYVESLKKQKLTTPKSVATPAAALRLPLLSVYEAPPIQQTLQRLLLKHSDMPQNRRVKKMMGEKKRERLLVDRCCFVSVLNDDPDSEDSDAAGAKQRNDRQRQIVRMIREGTLLPKELSFLNFVVDEQIDEFWLQPKKYAEEHQNDQSHGLSMQNIK